MDIEKNEYDKNAYEYAREAIKDGTLRSSGGVCAAMAFGPKGGKIAHQNTGICHRFISDHGSNIHYVVTSLRRFNMTGYANPAHCRAADAWYHDLLRLDFFAPVAEETVFIPGIPMDDRTKKNWGNRFSGLEGLEGLEENWWFIKVTDKNRHLVAPFLVFTRHPYEQYYYPEGRSNDGVMTLLGAWYHLCYKRGANFNHVFPIMNTAGIVKGKVMLMYGAYGHGGFDGIAESYPIIPRKDRLGKWGYSQQNFDFCTDPNRLIDAIKEARGEKTKEVKVEKTTHGFFNNPSLYYRLEGKDASGRKIGEGTTRAMSIPLGTLDEAAKLITPLVECLYV